MARRPGMRDHPPAASEGVWQVMSQPTRRRGRLRSGGAGPSIASIIAGRDVNTLNSPSGGAATIHRQHHCRPGCLHAQQFLGRSGTIHRQHHCRPGCQHAQQSLGRRAKGIWLGGQARGRDSPCTSPGGDKGGPAPRPSLGGHLARDQECGSMTAQPCDTRGQECVRGSP